MGSIQRTPTNSSTASDSSVVELLGDVLGHVPAAFAITHGPAHTLVSANTAFDELTKLTSSQFVGRSITDAFPLASALHGALDHAFRDGVVIHDQVTGLWTDGMPACICSIMPVLDGHGDVGGLVIEVREMNAEQRTLAMQRSISERMLLSALREQEVAELADESQKRAAFLAEAGRLLSESVEESTTQASIAHLTLFDRAEWCIVDLLDEDGTMHRLAIDHPNPDKKASTDELAEHWLPEASDPFGLPALGNTPVVEIDDGNIDDAVAGAAHNSENLRILRELGFGSLLTVPMIIRDRLLGAITFVAPVGDDRAFTRRDVVLATDLALRSAMALDNARLHGKAIEFRNKADKANQAKSDFLAHVSHELRTPLNAIGGYIDILDYEIHGPITDGQREQLNRVRHNQDHLVGMIDEMLSFIKTQHGLTYRLADIVMQAAVQDAVSVIEPLCKQKGIRIAPICSNEELVVRADPHRLRQILINLLSNAVKFTAEGGQIDVECALHSNDVVRTTISDTGVGIPPELIEAVFEPFFQVGTSYTKRTGGVGLGLAISRELARAMKGDLTLKSTPGSGSHFTVLLPLAVPD